MSFSAFDPQKPCVSLEETELFEKIKKHIGTKPSYEEFLKTLNLYTQQILDMDLLIVQLKPFLGNNKDLFLAFKQAIGYDPKEYPIERPALSAVKPDLMVCKTIASSPSYRLVPKEVRKQKEKRVVHSDLPENSGKINLVLGEIKCVGKY